MNNGQQNFMVTAESRNDIAYIKIQGQISEWTDSNGASLAAIIDEYIDNGVTECKVYLSTQGGSVFEAIDMVNHLNKFKKTSIIGGALIASAGTYFTSCFHTTIFKNTQMMIHKPKASVFGNENEFESQVKMLQNATKDYKEKYAKKTGKSEKEIENLWNKGDFWMTAQEALSLGFVDVVENKDENITSEAHKQLVACGAPNIEQLKPSNTNSKEMKTELLAVQLGLPESSTESQITAKIEALKKSDGALAQAKLVREAENKSKQAEAITALLDQAEKDKKITAAQRPSYQNLAEANFENVKTILGGAASSAKAISASLTPTPGIPKEEKEHDYQYYQENPEAWAKLEEENPQKATALADAYYSKND